MFAAKLQDTEIENVLADEAFFAMGHLRWLRRQLLQAEPQANPRHRGARSRLSHVTILRAVASIARRTARPRLCGRNFRGRRGDAGFQRDYRTRECTTCSSEKHRGLVARPLSTTLHVWVLDDLPSPKHFVSTACCDAVGANMSTGLSLFIAMLPRVFIRSRAVVLGWQCAQRRCQGKR